MWLAKKISIWLELNDFVWVEPLLDNIKII